MNHLLTLANSLATRHEEFESVVRELSAHSGGGSDSPDPTIIRRVRDDFGNELADQLFSVAKLQHKAQSKFGEGLWWVTERSLQQATPWQVSKLKAAWLGEAEAMDLCCGVGGDAMQLAARGDVIAIDCDPVIAQMAAANLKSVSSGGKADVLCQDVLQTVLPKGCALHIDPDRRSDQRRTTQPDHYRPAWEHVERMISQADAAVVKLAPAARIEVAVGRSHRCWISLSGSVREQSLIWGDAISRAGGRIDGVSAVKLMADGTCHPFLPGCDNTVPPSQSKPQEFLVDPDAAIRAAGLTEAFAVQHGLSLLGGPAGFLTGEATNCDSLSKLSVVGKVLWHGSADDRKIRRELRQRDMFPITIKVRGTDHDPAMLTKRYKKYGSLPVTMWFGRAGGRVFAAITENL